MKTLAALALWSVLFLTVARADWLMVQKVEGMGQPATEMLIKVKGDKIRVDMESMGLSMVMDAASGDVMNIVHSGKMVMKIKKAEMDALSETLGSQVPKDTPKQKLEATGRTEHINGYKADEYTWKIGEDTTAHYWIVRDFPDYKQLARAMERMQNLGPTSAVKEMSPRVSDFPGMPIRTVMETGGQKIETNLVSLKKATFPDSDFQAPSGYKEMAMPQMGGALTSPAQGQ